MNGPTGAMSGRPTKRTVRPVARDSAQDAYTELSENRRALATSRAGPSAGTCWAPPTLTSQRNRPSGPSAWIIHASRPQSSTSNVGRQPIVARDVGDRVDLDHRVANTARPGAAAVAAAQLHHVGHQATLRSGTMRTTSSQACSRSMTSGVVASGAIPSSSRIRDPSASRPRCISSTT